MATLSLSIDERYLKNGMAQVRLRINHKGTSAFVGTGIYVEPQYFISNSLYDPVHRKAYLAAEKREKITSIVRQVDEWLTEVDQVELATLTAKDIKERAGIYVRTHNKKEQVRRKKAVNAHDFMQFFAEYGESRLTPKTRRSYAYAWNVLFDYCKSLGWHTMSFEDIDYARLTDFATWLRNTGRSEATRHMLESYMRAAYKDAQKRHVVGRENDPYYDYSIAPVPQKDIDCLTVDDMRKVMEADLSQFQGLQRARDIALISFYLCGANLIDIYEMEKPKGNDVVFIRHKVTRSSLRPIYIRIEQELAALIEKYKGTKALFNFKESSPNYETFSRRNSRLLEGASAKIGIDITLQKIRRTWSSIAGILEIYDRVIDKSMGHVDSSVKDRHYEQYDWSRTARANRAIIDYIKTQGNSPLRPQK